VIPAWLTTESVPAMTARWLPVLVDAALKGTLLLALAGAATLLMRRASAASRHLVWFLAVGGTLVLPVLSAALPGWEALPRWVELPDQRVVVQEPDETLSTTEIVERPAPDMHAGIVAPPQIDQSAPEHSEPIPAPADSLDAPSPAKTVPAVGTVSEVEDVHRPPWAWALIAWVIGTMLVLGRLCLGRLSLWQLGRSARPLEGELWTPLLKRLSDDLGLTRPVVLLQSGRRSMPMAWGVWRPRLLLPDEASDWSAERRRIVLLHELAHLKRWDCLTLLVSQLACAAYWFNPLAWLAVHRMVSESERACDDLVLGAGPQPADYAEHLLQVASGLRAKSLVGQAAIAMARPSHMEGRLLAILDAARNRRPVTRLAVLLAVPAAVCLVLPLAMATMRPAADMPSPSATEPLAPVPSQAEGDLELDHDVVLDLVAGTAEYPQLAEAGRIRFETRDDRLWAQLETRWQRRAAVVLEVTVELLDANGEVLGRAQDEVTPWTSDRTEDPIMRYQTDTRFALGHWSRLQQATAFVVQVTLLASAPAEGAPSAGGTIPDDALPLKHVDDSAEGRRSLSASGHAVQFDRLSDFGFVEAVAIFASRYGRPEAPDEDFHVYLLNDKKQVLADLEYPYEMIERGEMRWYTLKTPPIEVTKSFYVALAFNPHRTKGVYLGLDEDVDETHSLTGLPDSGFKPVTKKYDWMVRVHLTEKPSTDKDVQRLADWKPKKKTSSFRDQTEVKLDTGKSDGKQSYGGAGPAVRIKLADVLPKGTSIKDVKLTGLRVYASRYGSGYSPKRTKLSVAVLDSKGKSRSKASLSYSAFSYKPKWADLRFRKPIAVGGFAGNDGEITIALDPKASRTKGIYWHYNKDPKQSHSLAGTIAKGFKEVPDREWMIRLYFQTGESK